MIDRTLNKPSAPDATPQNRILRYDSGAVFLHWLTALLVAGQIVGGFVFANMASGPSKGTVFTAHKTFGVTILLLALVRLAWRLANPPPPYPLEMPRWERIAGVWNHRAFYVLLIVLPLTGLLTISGGASAAGRTTTALLGGIPFPLIPGVSKEASGQAGSAHVALVWITLALLVLHIGAALKHQFERNRAAGRMPPFKTVGEW